MPEGSGPRHVKRRALLATVGSATSAALAGCSLLDQSDDGDGGGPIGRWLVDDESEPLPDHEAGAWSTSPAYYRQHSDVVPDAGYQSTIDLTIPGSVPVDAAAVDRVLSVGDLHSPAGTLSYTVITGTFGGEEVASAIVDDGGIRIGTDGDYVLLDDGGEHGVAVADGAVVTMLYPYGATGPFPDQVAPVLETARGDRKGLLARRPTPADVADRLRSGLSWQLTLYDPEARDGRRLAPFPGTVAKGQSTSIDGDRVRGRYILVFDDESDLEQADVEGFSSRPEAQGFDRVDRRIDGRVVTIELSADPVVLGD